MSKDTEKPVNFSGNKKDADALFIVFYKGNHEGTYQINLCTYVNPHDVVTKVNK